LTRWSFERQCIGEPRGVQVIVKTWRLKTLRRTEIVCASSGASGLWMKLMQFRFHAAARSEYRRLRQGERRGFTRRSEQNISIKFHELVNGILSLNG
jgi:hypothetical protein